MIQNVRHLLGTRRFLPIFVTQFLGAFNDNLFRTAMVMLVIYGIYRDAEQEAAFSAIAGGLFILPFFLLSALAGIWGMNFEHMPELKWAFGYPMALAAIASAAGILFWRFKRAGWL